MNMELSAAQIGDFERDGFLVARGVVDNATIAAVRRDFFVRVQYLSGVYGLPLLEDFDEAVTQLICRAPEAYQHMDISLPMSSEMAAMATEWRRLFGDQWRQESGVFVGDAIFRLISHPNIISIARRLLGPEVECSPVQHTRIKPPQHLLPDVAAGDANMSRTLWHQDEAVVHEGARGAEILTVWLAMTDATPENGCMFAVAGSHLEPDSDNTADFGLTTHCPGKRYVAEIYIPENAIDRARLSPLVARAGDAVLLHRRTIHGAGENTSSAIRWSFDLRYQPAGTPSGRECFPSFLVASESRPQDCVSSAEYCRRWLSVRDDIISGKTAAVFNERWNKYQGADLCA